MIHLIQYIARVNIQLLNGLGKLLPHEHNILNE